MKKVLILSFAIALVAGAAMAENHGTPPGVPNPFIVGPESGLTVGSDGTVYLTSISITNNVATTTIKAVRPTGAVAWTASVNGHVRPELSDGNLLYVTESTAADGTLTSTINAINTTTGAAAWTRALGGRIGDVHPFNGGTYVIEVTPSTTAGTAATRTLVAIGNDGSILWTLSL